LRSGICGSEQDQAVLDEALREGLNATQTAAAHWDESAGAGGHGANPQDRQGPPCSRIQTAHQEGSGIQALGQAAAETEVMKAA